MKQQISKDKRVALKTMAIKAKLANHIRKTLYGRFLFNFTDAEKIAFFDKVHTLNHLMHIELNDYKKKRKDRALVHLLREQRIRKIA